MNELMAGAWAWYAKILFAFCIGILAASFHARPWCRFCGERHPHHPEEWLCRGRGNRRQPKFLWPMHRHKEWQLVKEHGVGMFEKQKGQNKSKVYCGGRIEKCAGCPQLRIVPDFAPLQPVEIEKQLA